MQHKANWLKNYIKKYEVSLIVFLIIQCCQISDVYGMQPNFYDLALMEYIPAKNIEGVRNTLKQPVQINLCCKEYLNHTPLAEAVGTGSEEIVELILSHPGINVNQADEKGWTPIFIAIHLKLPKIVSLLLRHEVSLSITTALERHCSMKLRILVIEI